MPPVETGGGWRGPSGTGPGFPGEVTELCRHITISRSVASAPFPGIVAEMHEVSKSSA